jgi:hypothetical protein
MLISILLFIATAWGNTQSEVLLNPQSTKEQIIQALDEIRSMPDFDPANAEALIHFLEVSDQEDLRVEAAQKLYLHFHYKVGQFGIVAPTLLRPEILNSIERLMVFDLNPEVRIFLVRLGQILLGSFDDSPNADKLKSQLVDAYLPVLLLAFRHPSIELRIEANAAMDNLSETTAFRKSGFAKRTLENMLVFAKKHPEKDYEDYAETIANYLNKIKDPQPPRPR